MATFTNLPFAQEQLNYDAGNLAADQGLYGERLLRDFTQRTIPAQAGRDAARGSLYSSGASDRMQNLRTDFNDAQGDIQRATMTAFNDMARRRFYGLTGGMY